MIEFLYDKISSWSQDKSDEFHKNIPIVPWRNLIPLESLSSWYLPSSNDGMFFWCNFMYHGVTTEKYIWEITEDSYLFYRSHTAYYFKDGNVHRLSRNIKKNDWFLFNKLYEISQDRSYRIDIPIKKENIHINGTEFLYTVIQRSNKEWGLDTRHRHTLGLNDYQFLYDYINQSTEMMNDIKYIDERYNMGGTPDIGSILSKIVTDSVGTTWIDCKDWILPYDQHVKKTYGILSYYLVRSSEVSVLSESEKTDLGQYGLSKYASLLNNDTQALIDYNNEYLQPYLARTS